MTKRLLDVVLGTILSVVALPVIAVAAVAVAYSLRTWRVLFVQERVGLRGRPFRIVKLRTLPLDAPPEAPKYALRDVKTTRVGKFLRRTHLDELPQLLLVPVGRMSLVGPRPEMVSLAERVDPGFVAVRTSVRPGCTGLWQASIDSWRLLHERPAYDLFYARNHTLRLDLWILWRTFRAFVVGGKLIELGDVPAWAVDTTPAVAFEPVRAELPSESS